MPRLRSLKPEPEPAPPGAFMPDGCWNHKAQLHHRGSVHNLVAALCRARRLGTLTPQSAARTVLAANQSAAFPSHPQWASLHDSATPGASFWPLADSCTSAEQAVKREGYSTHDRHWCGERWSEGPQHECPEFDHHRPAPPSPEALAAMNALDRAVAARRAMLDSNPSPTYESPATGTLDASDAMPDHNPC